MSPQPFRPLACGLRFPRVSGDEPWFSDAYADDPKFSPRERG